MTGTPDISDEELTAYLDGELPPEKRDAIDRGLEGDDALAARLAALEIPIDLLREGAAAALQEAPAYPTQARPGRIGQGALVAASVAVLALGLGVFWTMRPAPTQDWVLAVANYQSLYVTETLAASEPEEERQARLTTLSEALGTDLTPLLGVGEIEYRRAQLLGFEGEPLVQVAYLKNGVPIAICITRVPGEDCLLYTSDAADE